jgi:hypothetical protein
MLFNSWLNSFRSILTNSSRRRGGRKRSPSSQVPEAQRLEDRALLAAVFYDSLANEVVFTGDAPEVDDLTISSTGGGVLTITSNNSDSFSLINDALGPSGFSLLSAGASMTRSRSTLRCCLAGSKFFELKLVTATTA